MTGESDKETTLYVRFAVHEAGEAIRALDDVCGMKDFNYAEMIRDDFRALGDDKAKAFWHEVWEYLIYMQVKDADTPIVITDDPRAELSWEKKK